MSTQAATPSTREKISWSRIAVAGLAALVAGLAALVAGLAGNLAVWFVGTLLVPVSPEFIPLANAGPTVVFTTIGIVAATVVYGVVTRLSRNPVRLYWIVATIALVLSLLPNVIMLVDPAGSAFAGITTGAVLILMLMHVVAYLACVLLLPRYASPA